ncbi:MAG: hypothetical protein KDA83_17055, partial [Planctomycetales bacterium]|nr:hypothetical protein [Planctomycetales bacterium]
MSPTHWPSGLALPASPFTPSKASPDTTGAWRWPTTHVVASRWQAVPGRAAALHQWLWQERSRHPSHWYAARSSSAHDVLAGATFATAATCTSRPCDSSIEQTALQRAGRILVLWLRENSSTAQRLLTLLHESRVPPRVIVPSDSALVSAQLQRELQEAGASLRCVGSINASTPESPDMERARAIAEQLPMLQPWPWLTHATRPA